jgi:hypothetical protein
MRAADHRVVGFRSARGVVVAMHHKTILTVVVIAGKQLYWLIQQALGRRHSGLSASRTPNGTTRLEAS